MQSTLRATVADLLGSEVVAAAALSGGDVADAFRVHLDDGRTVFAKTHRSAPPRFFSTEAAGLRWLRAADAVAIPEVLAVSDDPALLVLEWIAPGVVPPNSESDLGRDLALLHRAGAVVFGREDRRPTGSRQLPNDPVSTWAEFYATRRLLPLASLASEEGVLAPEVIGDVRAVAGRIEELVGPAEPPARLHGDLWAGNRLVGEDGRSWLIDPAAFGGHREFDLAMMRLFGGFGEESFASYRESYPLADGWEERVTLYQLVPLLVHAIKFGGGYVRAVSEAAGRYR